MVGDALVAANLFSGDFLYEARIVNETRRFFRPNTRNSTGGATRLRSVF